MFRNLSRPWQWTLLGLLAMLALSACSGEAIDTTLNPSTASAQEAATSVETPVIPTAEQENATPSATEPTTPAAAPADSGLSQTEIEGLLYMREEEKLARDVYITLYEQWGQRVFQNVTASEEQHMSMVLGLLEQYGLEDPAAGKGVGEFTNPELQALYDQLVAQGSQSLADALKVGAAIEEIDILDLQERITQTDNPAIITVYENLMQGSENHLRAFVGTLERLTGETYTPQYLSPEAYEAIINANGAGQGQGQGRGRGRGSGAAQTQP